MPAKTKLETPIDHSTKGVVVHRPCWGLDEKLDALRHCIAEGHDEDAQGHLFDLLSALRLRSGIKGVSVTDLTPEGHRSLALLSPNAETQQPRNEALDHE
jgi:hypothetical protein